MKSIMLSCKKRLRHWDLLCELVKTDFQMRYNNSVLGVAWVLLKPLLLFGILYFVFSYLFSSQDPHYRLNLLLGLILFSYFSEGTTRGMHALVERANIILKVNFPRSIVVISSIINSCISLALSLIIFFVFWLFSPTAVTWWYLVLPVYIVILSLFIYGLSLIMSIILIRFRDLGAIWEVFLSAFFYFTPIIYPLAIVPVRFQQLLMLNPLAAIVRDVRFIIVEGVAPGFYSLIYLGLISSCVAYIGYTYFNSHIKKSVENI